MQQVDKAGDQNIVVLASGDPLFYGVARYLCDKLGKDRFEVVPHVSSMQLAFARVKESWEDAYLTNLATHPLDRVIEKIRVADTVGMFTSEKYPPSRWPKHCCDERIDYFQAYVCENLGSPDERVTQGSLSEIAREKFAPLNVMILVRRPETPDRPTDAQTLRRFGNPDEMFLQARPKQGLLTPAEVRSIALAELAIGTKEHRVGRRRRQRIGFDRSRDVGQRGQSVRHRNGSGRYQSDSRQCRTVSREEFGARAAAALRKRGEICRSRIAFSSAAAGARLLDWWSWRTNN